MAKKKQFSIPGCRASAATANMEEIEMTIASTSMQLPTDVAVIASDLRSSGYPAEDLHEPSEGKSNAKQTKGEK